MTGGAVLVAIDQGTSSTKVVMIDESAQIVARHTIPIASEHPRPGWVQQDPRAILASVHDGVSVARDTFGERIAGFALSTQRESAVVWDRRTGEPLGPVLGWQDRRTTYRVEELVAHQDHVRDLTGLPLDPMFSALKIEHLLDQVDPQRQRSSSGAIAVGTIDSWLVAGLTGEHRIELGNASRTQLLDISTGDWDDGLLELFRIPRAALPALAPSDASTAAVIGGSAPVLAVLADSHAALFGHGARTPGSVKVTYGTGSSVMGLDNSGAPLDGLGRTIAWQRSTSVAHAFEGNILSSGATLSWLARVLDTPVGQLLELAREAPDDDNVELVPAFAGLGAPWWDGSASATLTGFTLGTTRAQLARAAADSLAHQVEDIIGAVEEGIGARVDELLVDGGPTANDWLMQRQADLSGRTVARSDATELSALGAAHMAGLAGGLWTDDELADLAPHARLFSPHASTNPQRRRSSWRDALHRSRSHVD